MGKYPRTTKFQFLSVILENSVCTLKVPDLNKGRLFSVKAVAALKSHDRMKACSLNDLKVNSGPSLR